MQRCATSVCALGLVSVLVVGCGLREDSGPVISEGSESGAPTESPMEEQQMSPIPSSLRDQCANAAEVLGFPVPCPGQLPVPRLPRSAEAACPASIRQPPVGVPCIFGDVFLFEYLDYQSVDPLDGVSHLVIRAVATQPGDGPCVGGRSVGAVAIGSRSAQRIECPTGSGLHSGHSVLHWNDESVGIVVSVYGHSDAAWALAEHIARTIRMTRPDGVDTS